ncbi:MAG: 50S ribosomal protein L11 methyltransferase [Gammaproteobacteria bacterium]
MWQQLIISPKQNADSDWISDVLSLAGADAVTLRDAQDDPIYEPDLNSTPLWRQTFIIGLFKQRTQITAALHLLNQQYPKLPYKIEALHGEDWQQSWQKYCRPICFNQRLWICPTWHALPKDDLIKVHLDPGLAFGTGTHPTTAMCIQWLTEQDLKNKTVIDYGCGSGILALVAAKLGAKKIFAIDRDPQALLACRDNAKRNQIDADQIMTALPQQCQAIKADILVANILANPLIELAPRFVELLKKDGQIVLSGILSEQSKVVQQCYARWFKLDAPVCQAEWRSLSGTRSRVVTS